MGTASYAFYEMVSCNAYWTTPISELKTLFFQYFQKKDFIL